MENKLVCVPEQGIFEDYIRFVCQWPDSCMQILRNTLAEVLECKTFLSMADKIL